MLGHLGRVALGSTVSGCLGWLGFFVIYSGKAISAGLFDQLFQAASNQFDTVEKAFAWVA